MYPRLLTGAALHLCLGAWAFAAPAAAAPDPGQSSWTTSPAAVVRGASPRAGAGPVHATSIAGVAWNADDSPIPHARVRLRDVVTGKVAATATADANGRFTFEPLEPGSYLVELVTDNGRILAVGHTFAAGAGDSVATFVRMGARAPWFTGFFGNAATAVAATAAAAGVTAIAPEAKPCSSPSPGCS